MNYKELINLNFHNPKQARSMNVPDSLLSEILKLEKQLNSSASHNSELYRNLLIKFSARYKSELTALIIAHMYKFATTKSKSIIRKILLNLKGPPSDKISKNILANKFFVKNSRDDTFGPAFKLPKILPIKESSALSLFMPEAPRLQPEAQPVSEFPQPQLQNIQSPPSISSFFYPESSQFDNYVNISPTAVQPTDVTHFTFTEQPRNFLPPGPPDLYPNAPAQQPSNSLPPGPPNLYPNAPAERPRNFLPPPRSSTLFPDAPNPDTLPLPFSDQSDQVISELPVIRPRDPNQIAMDAARNPGDLNDSIFFASDEDYEFRDLSGSELANTVNPNARAIEETVRLVRDQFNRFLVSGNERTDAILESARNVYFEIPPRNIQF